MAVFAVFLGFFGHSSLAQSVMDLPGMDQVLIHHELHLEDLEADWMSYAEDAVRVSQAWSMATEIKPNVRLDGAVVLSATQTGADLLALDIRPQDKPVAYATNDGRYIVVSTEAFLAKWTSRYILNAKSYLQ